MPSDHLHSDARCSHFLLGKNQAEANLRWLIRLTRSFQKGAADRKRKRGVPRRNLAEFLRHGLWCPTGARKGLDCRAFSACRTPEPSLGKLRGLGQSPKLRNCNRMTPSSSLQRFDRMKLFVLREKGLRRRFASPDFPRPLSITTYSRL